MGRRGPPKKPTELRIADGSHAPRNALEPDAASGIPEPMPWLHPDVKADYEAVAKTVQKLGVLTTADGLLLSLLASSITHFHKIDSNLHRDGVTEEAQFGTKASPEAQQIHKFREGIMKLASRFGLSPADRVNLIDETKRADQERDAEFFGRQPA